MTGPTRRPPYEIQLDTKAAKLLRKLDRPVQSRLVAAIAALSIDPRPHGVNALTGHPGLLRIRVGDYRVVYQIDDGKLIVLVVHLGHHSDVYDLF
ncbi:type II toxin-antitoxin system RelE/ParE family toxin [Solwaraspora sp. WMMA2056]|uniref:type II toxin-antitoxin system RelE family toxin n=1 Tax=Solwaraspora sp. WMMA2056 TaxID=3015161 RepID=UPI00259B771C|nr:type II toxin-antitoxin system RelE/ParE family toxin [Solwaraspora sp. WMMA2056]WJK40470.1 type II toxin-antitoxin system RelE/ParE family toxin [Solwaraspora sp. WMMA2056]